MPAPEAPKEEPWKAIPISKVPDTSTFNRIFGGKRSFFIEPQASPSVIPESRPSSPDPIQQNSFSSYRSPTVETHHSQSSDDEGLPLEPDSPFNPRKPHAEKIKGAVKNNVVEWSKDLNVLPAVLAPAAPRVGVLGVRATRLPEVTVLWFVVQLMRAKGSLFPCTTEVWKNQMILGATKSTYSGMRHDSS